MLKGSDVHACVCLESLCISFVWLTASSDKFQQSQTCFHFSAWQPAAGNGNQSFTHSHESRSTTCCTNTLRTHWLTAAIKPVCGEQTESFYVGLNKTKILLRISARACVYVLVHVQRALQLQWSLPTLFTLSEAEKRSSQHDLHQFTPGIMRNFHALFIFVYMLVGHFIRYTLLVPGWTLLEKPLQSFVAQTHWVLQTFLWHADPCWHGTITQIYMMWSCRSTSVDCGGRLSTANSSWGSRNRLRCCEMCAPSWKQPAEDATPWPRSATTLG